MVLFNAGIGIVLPVMLLLCGVSMTVYLRGFYLIHPFRTAKRMFSREGTGHVSPLCALSMSLAGTLGVGNIVGVAVALVCGGAGAVFWMWVSALFSMVLKYAEIVLAMRYRTVESGTSVGGPMYYMRRGVKGRCGTAMAIIFSALGVVSSFTMGNIVQMNAASDAMSASFHIPKLLFGGITAVLCAMLVFGGYHVISRFTSVAIPIISVGYLLLCIWVLLVDRARLPAILREIFTEAFSVSAAGGGVLGFCLTGALRHGIAKGVFSHEAGSGTAPMAHAGADTKIPAKQGILGIFEVFFDTMIICTLTALVVLLARDGEWITENGMHLVIWSFARYYGKNAAYFVSAAILVFAFSTVVCWAYYGKTCLRDLTRSPRWEKIYLIFYCIMTAAGSILPQGMAWTLSDLSVATMTVLNLSSVMWLRSEVRKETEAAGLCLPRTISYFKKQGKLSSF